MKKISLALLFLFGIYFSCYALTEEEVFNEKDKILSLYSFSNNATEIEREILTRTDKSVSLSNISWRLEQNISENIKSAMNRLDLNYAMTIQVFFGSFGAIIVYRRLRDQWFSYIHPIMG